MSERSDPGDPTISVVLPVHDQAAHIEGVVEGYLEAFERLPVRVETLLVANGCRDASAEICRRLSERPGVRLVELEQGGWGRAVRCGIGHSRGDTICYTNSARTTAEDLALLLLYAVANPGAVIKASRKFRQGWTRRIGGLLYNLECRTLFGLTCWDVNGTPKVFPRRFAGLLTLERDDDLVDLEFALICQREGYPLLEVPILNNRRSGGRSTTGMRSAARLYAGALRMYLQARRAR